MSATTPLERAARTEAGLSNGIDPYGLDYKRAHAVLTAALDVEEMARAALPYVGTFEELPAGEQEFRRGIARNIRASILGADL